MRVWPRVDYSHWSAMWQDNPPNEGLPSRAVPRLLYGPLYAGSVQIKHAEAYVTSGWDNFIENESAGLSRFYVMNTFQLKRLKASVDEALSTDEFGTVCVLSQQFPVELAIQIVGWSTPFSKRKADTVSPLYTSLAKAEEHHLPDGLFIGGEYNFDENVSVRSHI